MKINFPSLFQTSLEKYTYFFIFGNDGSVFERALLFLQKKFSSSLRIKTEADLLNSSFSQVSLFEEASQPFLTFVPHVTDKIITHIDSLQGGHFIFTSEKARAHSKLVTYFSTAPQSLAIAAYASPLLPVEFDFLTQGMALSEVFKKQLFKAYQNDYSGLLSALQKIKLFQDVPESYYELFLKESLSSEDMISFRNSFLLKNLKKAIEAVSCLSSSTLISHLRALTGAFLTLFELSSYRDSSRPLVWQKITSPVFFKDQPLFESALSRWKAEEIRSFLEVLLSLEYHVKQSAWTLPQVSQSLLKPFYQKG